VPNTLQKDKKVNMIKRLFLVALATAAVGASTRPALAQTHLGGNVTTIQTIGQGPGVKQGLFKVNVDEVGSTNEYKISVSYLSTFTSSTTYPSFVDDILVTLFDGPSGTAGVDPITGGTGGVGAVTYDANPASGHRYEFSDPVNGPNSGAVTLGQTFLGDVFVSGPARITGAAVNLSTLDQIDGSGQGVFVTPEGASLLLFLPGLIPVAVGLRRRRLNKS